MIRLAGMVLILSVLCFGIGVTRPVVLNYFSTDSSAEKWRLLQENPEQWQLANALMDMGILIVPAGALIFTFGIRRRAKGNILFLLAVASAISVSLAAAIWYSNSWVFPRFTVPMVFGISLLGWIIWQQYSIWGGTLTIAIELITVIILYIYFQDVPPGAHFLPLLIAGMTLLLFGEAHDTLNFRPG